jgi:hypothetical protein
VAEHGGNERTFLGLSKCEAGKAAGFITGLLAGIGVALALGKEIDPGLIRDILLGLVVLVAAIGGMLTGAIASGYAVADLMTALSQLVRPSASDNRYCDRGQTEPRAVSGCCQDAAG